jgi:hypothetical protein
MVDSGEVTTVKRLGKMGKKRRRKAHSPSGVSRAKSLSLLLKGTSVQHDVGG